MEKNDLTNQRFGRLVAIHPTDKRKNGAVVWECQCNCGNVVEVGTGHLHNGTIKSCGCLFRETYIERGKTMIKDITRSKVWAISRYSLNR